MKRASKAEASTARRKRAEADLEREPAAKAVAMAAIKAKAEKKAKSKAQAKDSGGHESAATPPPEAGLSTEETERLRQLEIVRRGRSARPAPDSET